MTQVSRTMIDDLQAEGWKLLTTEEHRLLLEAYREMWTWARYLIQYAPSCPTCYEYKGLGTKHGPECELAEVLK